MLGYNNSGNKTVYGRRFMNIKRLTYGGRFCGKYPLPGRRNTRSKEVYANVQTVLKQGDDNLRRYPMPFKASKLRL